MATCPPVLISGGHVAIYEARHAPQKPMVLCAIMIFEQHYFQSPKCIRQHTPELPHPGWHDVPSSAYAGALQAKSASRSSG